MEWFRCFSFGAITNKAPMSNAVQVLCGHRFSFFWDKGSGGPFLGHMVSVRLVSVLRRRKVSTLFSRISITFYIPTSMCFAL